MSSVAIFRLILRHTRIDIVRPRGYAAFQIYKPARKPGCFQRFDRFCTANAAFALQHDRFGRVDLTETFNDLVKFAQDHFAAEEKLLALHDYPDARTRSKKNRELIGQLTDYQKQVLHGTAPDRASFQHFFESWMVRHILKNDRKVDAFLSSKGVH